MPKRSLTTDQLKIFDEIENKLHPAIDEARAKLSAAGISGEEETLYCMLCDCNEFVHRTGSNNCGRSGCGHSWFRHNVW